MWEHTLTPFLKDGSLFSSLFHRVLYRLKLQGVHVLYRPGVHHRVLCRSKMSNGQTMDNNGLTAAEAHRGMA